MTLTNGIRSTQKMPCMRIRDSKNIRNRSLSCEYYETLAIHLKWIFNLIIF